MENFSPYSQEELRAMRRLILALGSEVEAWTRRLRRSADFLLSLSEEQAGIVAEQASAIAADPGDYGSEEALAAARLLLSQVEEDKRAAFVWREIVAIRRRHYGDLNEED